MDNMEMLESLGFVGEKYSDLRDDVISAFPSVSLSDYETADSFDFLKSRICTQGTSEYRCLVLVLAGMLHSRAEYEKRNISLDIWRDTMSDAFIWAELHERLCNGQIGIRETPWLLLHINLKLYRLGRLQYQLGLPGDEFKPYVKDERVVEVHVPDIGPLDAESCRKSFLKAVGFYGKDITFVCDSWLLEPELASCLSSDSNILSFQKFFHVFHVDKTNPQCHQRVFGFSARKDTSLQRRIIENESLGKIFGVGYGYFHSSELR